MTQIKLNNTFTRIRGGGYGSDAWIARIIDANKSGYMSRKLCQADYSGVSNTGRSGVILFTVTKEGIYEFKNFCVGSTCTNNNWSGFCELTEKGFIYLSKQEAIEKIISKKFKYLYPPCDEKMAVVLKLENIGNGMYSKLLGKRKQCAWVSEIIGFDNFNRITRVFVKGNLDWKHANHKCDRGLYLFYFLKEGKIYEICNPISHVEVERYFCIIKNSEISLLKKEEIKCLLKSI